MSSSIRKICFDKVLLRKSSIPCINHCTRSPFATAREISEDAHVKVLRFLLRKNIKNGMLQASIEEKTPGINELRDTILKERGFGIVDDPRTKSIKLSRVLNDETIVVKFNALYGNVDVDQSGQEFEVTISKNTDAANPMLYYFKFTLSAYPMLEQLKGECFSIDKDETGKIKNFGPTYSRQPDRVLHYCEDYLEARGIDRVLARYIVMESSRKNTREKLLALRGLVSFLGDEE